MKFLDLLKRLKAVSEKPMPALAADPEIPEPVEVTPESVAIPEVEIDPKDIQIMRLTKALATANAQNVRAWKYAADLADREVAAWRDLREMKMQIRQGLNEIHIWLNLNF